MPLPSASRISTLIYALPLCLPLGTQAADSFQFKALSTDGVPAIAPEIVKRVDQYQAVELNFANHWAPGGQGIVIAHRRHLGTSSLAYVAKPGAPLQTIAADFDDFAPDSTAQPGADGVYTLFTRNVAGKSQLHAFDSRSRQLRALSSAERSDDNPRWTPDGKQFAFTASTDKGARLMLASVERFAEARTLLEGDYVPLGWSADGKRLLLQMDGSKLALLDMATGKPAPLAPIAGLNDIRPAAVQLAADGESLFALLAVEGGVRLANIRLADQKISWVSAPGEVNSKAMVLAPSGDVLAYASREGGFEHLHLADARTLERLGTVPARTDWLTGFAFSADSQRLLFSAIQTNDTSDNYVFDRSRNEVVRWTSGSFAGLDQGKMQAWQRFSYPSVDRVGAAARQIPACIVRPAKAAGPSPVVIELGGAGAFTAPENFPAVDRFAVDELGATLIHADVRGSSNYGPEYEALDNLDKRADAVRDVGALLDWIKTQPDLDPSRVMLSVRLTGSTAGSILSYASLAEYGERLRGAIISVGPVNLASFISKSPAALQDKMRAEYGDERTEAGQQLLARFSAQSQAARIKTPLLVLQAGANARVPSEEVKAFVKSLRAQQTPVWYAEVDKAGSLGGFGDAEREAAILAAQFARERLLASR
ncbi:prolyl oligopeptidase family serine peptidase [Chitinimonas sp.]|uniref:S9 family peptidase n=1 Tax=Chitinimonas sp. TaxID=1934313 RepID=UPI0035B3E13A